MVLTDKLELLTLELVRLFFKILCLMKGKICNKEINSSLL